MIEKTSGAHIARQALNRIIELSQEALSIQPHLPELDSPLVNTPITPADYARIQDENARLRSALADAMSEKDDHGGPYHITIPMPRFDFQDETVS